MCECSGYEQCKAHSTACKTKAGAKNTPIYLPQQRGFSTSLNNNKHTQMTIKLALSICTHNKSINNLKLLTSVKY